MKRILCAALAAVMIFALCICASAESFIYGGTSWTDSENTQNPITVKKAATTVVHDGIISEGEYENANIYNTPDANCYLHVVYLSPGDFLLAEAMVQTVEYYFSWNDTSLNLAARAKLFVPDADGNPTPGISQKLSEGTNDPPGDDFLFGGAGMNIYFGEFDTPTWFYYSISKNTDTDAYLEGHYGQLGLTGAYNPEPGTDYAISYDYATSYVTYEWTIPITSFLEHTPAAGDELSGSIGLMGGYGDDNEHSCYGVSLGDEAFMVAGRNRIGSVTFVLSDETVGNDGGDDTTAPGTTEPGDTTAPGTTEPGDTTEPGQTTGVTAVAVTDDEGHVTYIDPTTGETVAVEDGGQTGAPVSGTAPRTGDPMIILAAVTAVGAAGAAFISKKRRG